MPFLLLCLPVELAADAPPKLPQLRRALLAHERTDQQARSALENVLVKHGMPAPGRTYNSNDLPARLQPEFIRIVKRMIAVDAANRAWFRRVLDRHGWPGRSLVGADGADAAWLLAQHADADPEFQRRCVELMSAMPAGEVDPKRLASLRERYASNARPKP